MRRSVLFLISICVAFSVHADSSVCLKRHCLAVVDAGSSGSRVHLFAYDVGANSQPIKISELWSKKVKPGFSTIDLNQPTIDAYLNNLFSGAPEQNIPVYFYATAGMRLLPQPKQQQYYQSLKQWFSSQAQWTLVDAKTITGSEEGLFGWLAVNYQLGNLDSPGLPVVGVMDMGGASVQISFPVRQTDKINQDDLIPVNVAGQDLVLFVHSFLGLGQTVLSQQFLDTKSCLSNGYQLPSGVSGEGDASLCRQKVAKLINSVHEVDQIIQPVLLEKTSSWYAIGGVASLADDKPFSFQGRQFTSQSLLEQGDSAVCHQQWNDISTQYPGNDYLYGYCLFPAYYYALMVDGYGINPEQPINLMPSGQNADWTLGVVMRQH